MPRPTHSMRLERCPRSVENRPIHSGAEATATAARPDDTDCSAMLTMPLPKPQQQQAHEGAVAPLRRASARHAAQAQHREHQRAGDEEADARHQQRRPAAFQREADAEVGGTPDQVEHRQRHRDGECGSGAWHQRRRGTHGRVQSGDVERGTAIAVAIDFTPVVRPSGATLQPACGPIGFKGHASDVDAEGACRPL